MNYYNADVANAQDYYPFGMQMPGRKYTATGSYRYGFNGKEQDKETIGTSTYDYGFRIYGPALGRFLSVDPLAKSYPWYTPYQFAGNKPIANVDLDGREELWYNLVFNKEGTTVIGVQFVKEVDNRGLFDGSTTYHMAYEGNHIYTSTAREGGLFERHKGGYETLLDLEKTFVGMSKDQVTRLNSQAVERNAAAWAGVATAAAFTISEGQSESFQASIQADVSFSNAINYATNTSGVNFSLVKPTVSPSPTSTTNKQAITANGGNTQAARLNTASAYSFTRTETPSGNSSAKTVGANIKIINEGGNLAPIEVANINNKLYVINGHHRVEAAMRTNTQLRYKELTKSQWKAYGYKSESEIIGAAGEASMQRVKLDNKVVQKAATQTP